MGQNEETEDRENGRDSSYFRDSFSEGVVGMSYVHYS